MATRRDAREWALQLLFQLDMNPTDKLDEVFASFWRENKSDVRSRAFAEETVRGVVAARKPIDEMISSVARNWNIRRMGGVDRNVIRMAIYEMQNHADVPPAVVINEAVDLAKYFSSAESGKFVNGILDRIRLDLNLAPRGEEQPGKKPGRTADKAVTRKT
jgi:transcription antitermination protein NusB